MPVLEATSLSDEQARDLRETLLDGRYINGVALLATCNRLEVLADVSAFHGGLADIGTALVQATGLRWELLSPHLYAHFDDKAMEHLLTVVCGLDSMALGEAQILGQVRGALTIGQDDRQLSGELHSALQQALRVGKRAHSETGLDSVAQSLLQSALESAPGVIGSYSGAKSLVIGAGAMSGLVVANLERLDLGRITVINRTFARAERLAASVAGRAVELTTENLIREIADADLIVSCTGGGALVIDQALLLAGMAADTDERPNKLLVDLAVPRDIDEDVRQLPNVSLISLDDLARIFAEAPHHNGSEVTEVIATVRAIIAEEMINLRHRRRAREIAPTVAALHGRSGEILDLEISRLNAKIGESVDVKTLGEVHKAMRRVAEKILHTPTVRLKELVAEADGVDYAEAVSTLFDLPPTIDPDHVRLTKGAAQ